jgi:hypothetical protein
MAQTSPLVLIGLGEHALGAITATTDLVGPKGKLT